METALACTVATLIIWCIPGIFGFLVWELKENWRLYAANRPKRLCSRSSIGQHGETMARLLKPGFHSGTLPKRFAKLRRAERRALAAGKATAVRKHREALRHVELAVRRYIERELVELFAESRPWQAAPPVIDETSLATNRIKIGIRFPDIDESILWVAFDMRAGWMLAGMSGDGLGPAADNSVLHTPYADSAHGVCRLQSPLPGDGFGRRLSPAQRHVLATACTGLYATGGVELLRQQIEAAFPLPPPPYDLVAEGLLVWPDEPMDVEVLYNLRDGWRQLVPRVLSGYPRRSPPTLDRSRIVFRDRPLTWEQWVAAWESGTEDDS